MFKKILAAVVSAAMVLTMSSCVGNEPKRPEPELTEDGKKIVKVYALRVDPRFYDDIKFFNDYNGEYKVQLTEFSIEYGENSIDQFNAAMAAGNFPDVFIYDLDFQFPLESYAQKGMLADLYEFIDNDPDISRDDLSEVVKAFEWDGKLYRIKPSFYIYSAVGKTSVVGGEQGITVDRLIELVNEYPDSPFPNTYNAGLLSELISYGYNNFIDFGSGKCSFDSAEFIKLLEFCDQFPDEPKPYDEYSIFDEAKAKRNGTMPFAFVNINYFCDIRRLRQDFGDEPITFIGFPGVGGNGSVIYTLGNKFSVFSKGANPEGGWEFVKYFLSEHYQNRFINDKVYYSGVFPIRQSVLEKLAEEAKQPYWSSPDKEYQEPDYGLNTDEDNRLVYELMNGAVEVQYNLDVINMVREEAGAYFSGQKSAKEVAEIIQNRVQNYLDENR